MPQTISIQKTPNAAAHASESRDLIPAPAQSDASTSASAAFNQALKEQTVKFKNTGVQPKVQKGNASAGSSVSATATSATSGKENAPAETSSKSEDTVVPKDATAIKSEATKPDASQQDTPVLDPSHVQTLVAYVNQIQEVQSKAASDQTQTSASDTQTGAQSLVAATGSDAPTVVTTSGQQGDGGQADPDAAPAGQAAAPTTAPASPAPIATADPAVPIPAAPVVPIAPVAPGGQIPGNQDKSAGATVTTTQNAASQSVSTLVNNTASQGKAQPDGNEPQVPQQNSSSAAPAPPKQLAFKGGVAQYPGTSNAPTADTSTASTDVAAVLATVNGSSVVAADVPPSTVTAKLAEPAPGAPAPIIASIGAAPQTTSTSATNASTAQQSPAPSQENVLDQVVLGLRGNLDPQNGKAEIRLDPPNMGTLKVSIALDKGSLTAQFETSTDVVRDLLNSHIDKLRSVLEGQGITVDHLSVQTAQTQPTAATPQSQTSDQGSAGSSNHDGRSAGGFEQQRRGGQRDTADQTFASTFQQARESPLAMDVLA
jgi:flagellar hook-length control protein FliK